MYNYKELLDEGVRTGIVNGLRLPIISYYMNPQDYIDIEVRLTTRGLILYYMYIYAYAYA